MDDESVNAPNRWVDIEFDCLPLRTVGRVDVPLDASPKYQEFVLSVKKAVEEHGVHNTYFLHNASCTFHMTNDASKGMVEFSFQGTLFTDESDRHAKSCRLEVNLLRENCDWLTETVVRWLSETVKEALLVEFDAYIEAGDLSRAEERIKRIQAESDASEGFMGMFL